MTTLKDSPTGAAAGRRAADSATGWVELVLIFAIFFVVGGAPAPHVNEAHYLTKAKHYWDATYCPGDFFLDSADPHLVFYWSFGWLTRVVPLTAAAWIGRIAAWLLLAYAWQRLARAVASAPWTAPLSAAIWVTLTETANFAGEWVVGGVEAKCFAYGFVLLGLAAIAEGRWRTPWIWFGLASAFHVLVGAWAVLAALATWATEPRERRTPIVSLLPGLALGGVLSLPGLLPALALERNADPAVTAAAAQIYVFERLPHHLAPLSLPQEELQTRRTHLLITAVLFFGLWLWVERQRRVSAAAPCGVPEGKAVWQPLLAIMRFAGIALATTAAGLLLEAALENDPQTAARVLRYYWFRQADVVVPLAIALAGARLTTGLLHRHEAPLVVLAVLPLIACGWFLASTALRRAEEPRPPAVARLDNYQDWQDAATWVRSHTPADALFLTPRAGHSFKWYAARADVANHKDVPQDAASVVEWRRRCEELFPTVAGVDGEPRLAASPEHWGVARIRQLARKYGATHVIARSYPPLDLPVVYPPDRGASDSYYTVYELGAPPVAAASP